MSPTAANPNDYQSLFNASPTAAILLDANGIILDANQTVYDWLDCSPKDILHKNIFLIRVLPRKSKMIIVDKVAQRLDGQEVFPYAIEFKGKDKAIRRGLVSETHILSDKGELEKVLVALTDVTRFEGGGMAGDVNESIYKTVFDHAAFAITVADGQERLTAWNKFTETFLGLSYDDLRLKPVSTLYPEEEWRKIRSYNIRQLGFQHRCETKVTNKDGVAIDVELSISALKDGQGNITGSVGIMQDIRERKQFEQDARVAQSRYQMIFDNSAVAIMMADEKERIISWNPATEALLGKGYEDLFMKPVASLYPEEEWERLRSLEIRKIGKPNFLESKVLTKDGGIVDVNLALTILKDADGQVTGSIGFLQDIGALKRIEKERGDLTRMKSDFVSMVSHELRTPITSIKGNVNLILDESAGAINEEQKDFLQTAMKNINRLERLISDILDYQKLSASAHELNLETRDVNAMAHEVQANLNLFAQSKNLILKTSLASNCPPITFDYQRVAQVLKNLVENAIKFTDAGSVTISTKLTDQGVVVSVSDTGIGIKKDDFVKLFNIFSQIKTGDGRDTGDTGLGLAISKLIIDKHNGKIWAESTPGKGSTFAFLLPLTAAPQIKSEKADL